MRLLLLLALWAANVLAAERAIPARELDDLIEKTRLAFEAPGLAVAIVDGERLVYARGFGVRVAGGVDPVTPDTRFAIASTTKAFTTTAIAILVDEGKMSWEDRPSKHLPGFRLSDPAANELVTMRDLVCHRTGLSRNDVLWYNTTWGREEILARIREVPLTKPFRSAYQYQNIMFLAAGEAVGRASGGTWEQFILSRIYEPLGMRNSGFNSTDAQAAPDAASPHVRKLGKVTEIPWKDIANIGPAGSLNSSVRDLSRWLSMHMNGGMFEGRRIVSEKELTETHSPQMVIRDDPQSRELNPETSLNVYGLGWRLQDYRGRHMVSHGGAIDGFRAQVAFLPKEKLGVVVLANLGGNNLPEALRFAIFDTLLDLPRKDWNGLYLAAAKKQEQEVETRRKEHEAKRNRDSKPSLPLPSYTGSYENAGYGTVEIKAVDGGLMLAWGGNTIRMPHWHYDTFESPADGTPLERTPVTFTLDKDGEPVSLTFLEQTFSKVKPKK